MSFSLTFFVVAAYVFPGALVVVIILPLLTSMWPPLSSILAAALHTQTVPAIAIAALGMASSTCLGAGLSDAFLWFARRLYRPEKLNNKRADEATIARDPKTREIFVYMRLSQLDLDAWAGRIRLGGASGLALIASGLGYAAHYLFGTPSFALCGLAGVVQISLGLCFVLVGCQRVEQYDQRIEGLAQFFAHVQPTKTPAPTQVSA